LHEAALARGGDWNARARREAAAILDECGADYVQAFNRETLLGLLAIAWLQGVNLGSHETLAAAEVAFTRAVDAL
jgi:hypothetical protein